jgi:single-stranded-DNA-specific exonuclease
VGVVGIVASRVLQEFYRPTIILGGDGHEWRGSGRSIEGFDLAAALRRCDDLLVRHGGHAMAAGLTVRPDHVNALRQRLNQLARQTLKPGQLQPLLRLDAAVSLEALTEASLDEIERLQPFGQENPPVQLLVAGVTHRHAPQKLGREEQHAKFWVSQGGRMVEAVWWGGGGKPWPDGRFDLAVVPQVREFRGQRRLQLRVLDWRPGA